MGKEIRTVKMIFNKDGHGSLSTRISIPKSWADKLGFSQDGTLVSILLVELACHEYEILKNSFE